MPVHKQDHRTRTRSNTIVSKPPATGQICYVYESIATPIELLPPGFLQAPSIQARPDLVKQSQEALDRIHASGSQIGKVRPCILMRCPVAGGLCPETVWLQGTFGGADPASTGKVNKHFVRGIFLNCGLPGSRHLHLVPEGRKKNSWVIAFEFETMRPISDTWFSKTATQGVASQASVRKREYHRKGAVMEYQQLEKTSQAILRDECGTCLDDWQALCQDQPDLDEKPLTEHRDQRLFASRTTLNSSMSSLSLYAPSSVTIPMDPLQEELEGVAEVKGDVVQATRIPRDPCKICGKRKMKECY